MNLTTRKLLFYLITLLTLICGLASYFIANPDIDGIAYAIGVIAVGLFLLERIIHGKDIRPAGSSVKFKASNKHDSIYRFGYLIMAIALIVSGLKELYK